MSWGKVLLAALSSVILAGVLALTVFAGSATVRNLRAHLPGGEHPRIASDASARVGVEYRFELSTHCGVTYARFDRRWWEAAPPLPEDHDAWGRNVAWGTMTLLDDKMATFESDAGRAATFVPVPLEMVVDGVPARRDATGRLVPWSCL
jgi:hypothetical protein